MYGWLINHVWLFLILIVLAAAGWKFLFYRVKQENPEQAEKIRQQYRKLFKL